METYFDPQDLGAFSEIGKDAHELANKFFYYYSSVFAEGALTEREKAIIALTIAHTVHFSYCIDASLVHGVQIEWNGQEENNSDREN